MWMSKFSERDFERILITYMVLVTVRTQLRTCTVDNIFGLICHRAHVRMVDNIF